MLHKIVKSAIILSVLTLLFAVQGLYSKNIPATMVDIKKLNRYDEDRILFQQFETPHIESVAETQDNSIAMLMIIKSKKIFMFKDGYDDPDMLRGRIIAYSSNNQTVPDLWENKISGSPNFIMITDRKVEIQKSQSKDVAATYKDFYLKIRNDFLKKHVGILYSLIINRKDSDLLVTRKEVYRKMSEGNTPRFAITVTGRTTDGGIVYYAEDADGDGITETFTAHSTDGFNWGYGSGPNLICIKNNTQKDIEAIIGKIANIAYYGSPDEDQIIKKTFPTPEKISTMINDIYKVDADTDKFLKDNKIDINDLVEKSTKQPEGK